MVGINVLNAKNILVGGVKITKGSNLGTTQS